MYSRRKLKAVIITVSVDLKIIRLHIYLILIITILILIIILCKVTHEITVSQHPSVCGFSLGLKIALPRPCLKRFRVSGWFWARQAHIMFCNYIFDNHRPRISLNDELSAEKRYHITYMSYYYYYLSKKKRHEILIMTVFRVQVFIKFFIAQK